MLTVTALPSGPLVASTPAPDAIQAATQFDRAAEHARRDVHGEGLGQVAGAMLDKLERFVERAETLSHHGSADRANAAVPVGDDKMGQAMQSLQSMFDRSIETQLVVRAATQVSGAANTLVRGQ